MRVALLENGEPQLLLTDVVRHEDRGVRYALVINGGWEFERDRGTVSCVSPGHEITYPDPGYTEYPVPDDWPADHNEVFRLIRQNPIAPSTLIHTATVMHVGWEMDNYAWVHRMPDGTVELWGITRDDLIEKIAETEASLASLRKALEYLS